jgi:hypothetical protein
VPGQAPYFNKDVATGAWSGMCTEMAKDIAAVFDGEVQYLESTYGNSVLDLQGNKIDLGFALNPTPKRGVVIDFTHPFYLHGFGMVGAKGFHASNWGELDEPEVKIAVDIGRSRKIRHSASSRCSISRGSSCPTCMGVRMEADKRWHTLAKLRKSSNEIIHGSALLDVSMGLLGLTLSRRRNPATQHAKADYAALIRPTYRSLGRPCNGKPESPCDPLAVGAIGAQAISDVPLFDVLPSIAHGSRCVLE